MDTVGSEVLIAGLSSNSAVTACSNPHPRLAFGRCWNVWNSECRITCCWNVLYIRSFYCGFTSTVSKINFPDLRALRATGLKFHILLLWLFILLWNAWNRIMRAQGIYLLIFISRLERIIKDRTNRHLVLGWVVLEINLCLKYYFSCE